MNSNINDSNNLDKSTDQNNLNNEIKSTISNDNSEIDTQDTIVNSTNDYIDTSISDTFNTIDSKQSKYESKSPLSKLLTRFFTILKNVIKYPVEMMSSFVSAVDVPIAIMFFMVNTILSSLLFMSIFSHINTSISNIISSLSRSIYIHNTFSLLSVFVYILLLYSVFYLLFSILILFFTNIVFGYNTNFKQSICISSCISIGSLPFTTLSLVVSLLSPLTALFIFIIGIILGVIFLTCGLKGLNNIKENNIPYIIFFSIVLFLPISYFITTLTFAVLLFI